MRLKSFRIVRYKSILDSGECALASDCTILIGKNESGKTAVLEALRDFDREQSALSPQALAVNGAPGLPELLLTFEISPAELDAALQESGVILADEIRQALLADGIALRKTYDGEYRLDDRLSQSLSGEAQTDAGEKDSGESTGIASRKQRLGEILKVHPIPDVKFGQDVKALQESILDLRRLVKSRLNFIDDESEKMEAVEILHSLTNPSASVSVALTPRQKLVKALVKALPRLIYFSDFKDVLPFEISIDVLKENATVCDFARLAQLDLDALMAAHDTQRRINLLNRASAVISGSFLNDWEQDRIELVARPEGNKILFGVKEQSGTDVYKMEQRSRGFQWFLSFYLRMNRYRSESVVLLMDEPGMNLHPTAQKNVIRVIEQALSETMQVIFSTHSPALIDVNRLDRIRYVVKTKESGSVVFTGLHDAVDSETLAPVSMATDIHSLAELTASAMEEKEAQSAETLPEQNEAPPETAAHASPAAETAKPQGSEKPAAKEAGPEESEYPRPRKPLFNLFGR